MIRISIMKRIIPALIMAFLAASPVFVFGDQAQPTVSRPASIDEINQLFNLAIARPERSRFVADIELIEPPATQDQIAATLKLENEVMKTRDGRLSPEQMESLVIARSNALVRAMSGRRIQHVEEWYSGHYNRLDQTDEALLVSTNYLQANSDRFHDTFVNIHDPKFSPYTSFTVNNELHSATLTRNPETYYRVPNDLWRVCGLDQPLTFPLLFVLVDVNSINTNALQSLNPLDHDVMLSSLKADSWKVQRLHDGLDPNWHLEAKDENLDGVPVVRFNLEGKYPAPDAPMPLSSIQVIYWIGQIAGKPVCIQAMLTNLTLHSSFLSKREQFDNKGFPHVWKTSTLKDGFTKEFNAKFKEIDLNPIFTDTEIFTPKFQTNYTVSDITSGTAIRLQKSIPKAGISRSSALKNHTALIRSIMLGVFLLLALITAFVVFKKRRSK